MAPTSLHILSHSPASLFCKKARAFRSCASQLFSKSMDDAFIWISAAVFFQPLIVSPDQLTTPSMYSSSSSQVITPGVESGCTKSGHLQFGYAPTSLHILSHSPASMFCRNARCFLSVLVQLWCEVCSCEAIFFQPLIVSPDQLTRPSMYSSNSSQVITPGVESGCTKSGHLHFG